MTAAEAADFLRISLSTLRKLVKSGRLQCAPDGSFEVGPLLRVRSLEPAPVRWRHGPPSQEAIDDATDAERWEWTLSVFGGWGEPIIPRSGADLRQLYQRIHSAWRFAGTFVSIA